MVKTRLFRLINDRQYTFSRRRLTATDQCSQYCHTTPTQPHHHITIQPHHHNITRRRAHHHTIAIPPQYNTTQPHHHITPPLLYNTTTLQQHSTTTHYHTPQYSKRLHPLIANLLSIHLCVRVRASAASVNPFSRVLV